MEQHFSQSDIMLIEKEIGRKSYADIAFLLDRPTAEVTEFISRWIQGRNIVSFQQALDAKHIAKPGKKEREPKKKKSEPMVISRVIEKEQKLKRDRNGQPIFKTKVVDYSKMQEVRIDQKTCIYIKPGQDPVKARRKYLDTLKQHNSRTTEKEAVAL